VRTVERQRERGAGVFGTSFGLFIFLSMMFVAVNAGYALYARSMVTNAAHDAARHVAGYSSAGDRDAARQAESAAFTSRLGNLGPDVVSLEWQGDDPDVVAVRVRASPPSLLPAGLVDIFGIGDTDREIRVRVERER
jgi:Flp pilus assembly protein TadG